MRINERIEKAKKFAKDLHIQQITEAGLDPTHSIKREWREDEFEGCPHRYFALDGSPDVAFVIADLSSGKVFAFDQHKKLQKVFSPEED